MEFMYLVFTRMPGESYRRRFRLLLFSLLFFVVVVVSSGIIFFRFFSPFVVVVVCLFVCLFLFSGRITEVRCCGFANASG